MTRAAAETVPGSAVEPVAGEWLADAACVYVDPEVFFLGETENGPSKAWKVRMARLVCSNCPVLAQCREWAIESLAHGIAGGLTAEERRAERARRGQVPRRRRPATACSLRGDRR